MKKVFLLILVVLLSVSVIGCSMSEEQKALEIAKQYKFLDYTVEDTRDIIMNPEEFNKYLENIYQKVKPLVSDETYSDFVRQNYALKHQYNFLFNVTISVKKIDFELYDSNKTELRYNYNITLEIKHIDEGLSKEITKKGQMTLKKQDNGSWKITRDSTEFLSKDEVQFSN